MSKEIKTKPASRKPKEMDKAARAPKELIRRGMSNAVDKLSEREQEPAQNDAPENYATAKAQEHMDSAAHKAGDAAQAAAGKVKKQIFKQIKARKDEPNPAQAHKSDVGRDASGGDVHQGGTADAHAPKRRSEHQSVERGRRHVQQMARERRALRNTETAKSVVDMAEAPARDLAKDGIKSMPKGAAKTADKSVKAAERTVKATGRSIKTANTAAKVAAKTARKTAKATKRAAQTAKAAARASAQAAKATAKAVVAALKLAIAAIKGLVAAIAAGGWVVLVVLLIIVAIAAILASPAGILTGGGGDGTPTVAEAVRTVNEEMYEKVEEIQSRHSDAKEVQIIYNGDAGGQYVEHWVDILGVFAVKCNLDPDTPQDVIVMDEAKMALLRQVFWDMVSITYEVETKEVPAPSASPAPSPKPTPETEKILYIHINSKGYANMPAFYRFTDEQTEALDALMEPDMRKMLLELLTLSDADLMLTPEEIAAIEANLPPDLSPARRMVVLTAHSLVGKVHYFWGGKSEVIGWDVRWGTPKVVTSGNSPTTGTTRPFGLDCSGFVTWTFINAAQDKNVAGIIGHGTANQFPKSTAIGWNEALPGDLAFFSPPGGNNHVGVVVGRNTDGSLLICHCSSSKNNVVVSVAKQGQTSFKYIRRPDAYYAIYP